MSAVNNELLITFEELLQLENSDISVCVTKNEALNICETSSAAPIKIYNLWAQKLFKSYILEEFTNKDWERIFEYLRDVLKEFVENLSVSTEESCKEVEQWWLNSLDLLKCMQAVITLNVSILSLIMTFVLEVIIKTWKYAEKKNLKILCNLQQLVVTLTNNCLSKMTIKDDNDVKCINKIAYSLCEVGSVISYADIKTAIETWRTLAKLCEKLHTCNKNFSFTESAEGDWNEKAILGIFKELKKILNFYHNNPDSSSDNLLQIAQFYLKILRLIINYFKQVINKFAAVNSFIEIYSFCTHAMQSSGNPKMESFVIKPLFDIFSLVYKENIISEAVLKRTKDEVDNSKCCQLVFNYLQFYNEYCIRSRFNVTPNWDTILKLYNSIVEGSLIFVDKDKYQQLLEILVVSTILDCTNTIHKKLCEYVTDSSWIRACTSVDILILYYSYILRKPECNVTNFKLLEFWILIWNKLNNCNDTYQDRKKLIELLLKSILINTSDAKVQQHVAFNKLENIEIILLQCGKNSEQNVKYFHKTLDESLKKIQQRHMSYMEYKRLINLLHICISRPQIINDFLKMSLLETLKGLLSLPAGQLNKFQEFVNNCLQFFSIQHDQDCNQKLVKILINHEQQCYNIHSVFLVEFLLKHRPYSIKLLTALNNAQKLTSNIINLIDYIPSDKHQIDLAMFKDLQHTFLEPSNNSNDLEQIKKKPRLDQGNLSNIKFILNDIHINTHKLVNFPRSAFDEHDFDIMRTVKNTIEKLLTF